VSNVPALPHAIGTGSGILGFRKCWCPSPFPLPSLRLPYLSVFHSLFFTCRWISFAFFSRWRYLHLTTNPPPLPGLGIGTRPQWTLAIARVKAIKSFAYLSVPKWTFCVFYHPSMSMYLFFLPIKSTCLLYNPEVSIHLFFSSNILEGICPLVVQTTFSFQFDKSFFPLLRQLCPEKLSGIVSLAPDAKQFLCCHLYSRLLILMRSDSNAI